MTTFRIRPALNWCVFLLAWLLVACGTRPTPTTPTLAVNLTSTPTSIPLTPTVTPTASVTPTPLVARVNDEGITLEEYQAELVRYQRMLNSGTNLATNLSGDPAQVVLDDLINQVLLAQSATSLGFTLDEAALQARIDELASQIGGKQALEAWKAENGYTPQSFERALRRSLEAAWMRDQIASSVPETAEQIHARQILLYNSNQASEVFAQLQSGEDFTTLAKLYDPVAGGELGWFPRGYLTEKALEEAAFSLEPKQYSQIIQTPLGYHILFVIERDPARALSPNARLILQEQALSTWLEQRRMQTEIQIFQP
mgnify:CR=1 FL=1